MVNVGPRLYDRKGRPIDFARYTRLFLDKGYQRLADTHVGPLRVATVWLGADEQAGSSGPPLIFQTSVRGRDGTPLTVECYPDEARARAGHARAVAEWTARTGHRAEDLPAPDRTSGDDPPAR